MNYVAANGANRADFFQQTFRDYLKSDAYKIWDAQHSNTPTSKEALADPLCAGQGAC